MRFFRLSASRLLIGSVAFDYPVGEFFFRVLDDGFGDREYFLSGVSRNKRKAVMEVAEFFLRRAADVAPPAARGDRGLGRSNAVLFA